MNTIYFIVITAIFCLLQFILLTKTKNSLIKYFPVIATTVGLLFSFVLYLGIFGTKSPSVIAENQYFARFISIPLGAGFIGSLLGTIKS